MGTDTAYRIYAEDEKQVIHSYIVMPALVYGVSSSPFKSYSLQIPTLTDLAIKRGQAGQVGKGLSQWVAFSALREVFHTDSHGLSPVAALFT